MGSITRITGLCCLLFAGCASRADLDAARQRVIALEKQLADATQRAEAAEKRPVWQVPICKSAFPLDVPGQLNRLDVEMGIFLDESPQSGQPEQFVSKMGMENAVMAPGEWDLAVLEMIRRAEAARAGRQADAADIPGDAVLRRGRVLLTKWINGASREAGQKTARGVGMTLVQWTEFSPSARFWAFGPFPVTFARGEDVEVIGYETGSATGGNPEPEGGATTSPVAAVAILKAGSVAKLKDAYRQAMAGR